MTERELFTAALTKAIPAERDAFLDLACAGDAPLRQRVESLLAEHYQLGSFMDVPSPAVTIAPPPVERLGTQIGPYKLLQQIGEGGMGVVYMAEQTQPVQRMVALKVIKPGMDSRQVIARFEAERQALAMMDHVNIARVLDAGATESGRPYFVMELVHGVPITSYCDEHRLTPRQRLELFVPVCQAIQHAHQKGIIHRDIKPSNVMVTLYDGKPVPKVIDFGVAKATEQKLTERTLFTQYGTLVGTLEYMSPEQAESSALGVDTRSDIYSLGVLLYELLTGSTPLSSKRVKEAAYNEILRVIREEEPPKPSTRLSDSGESLASISALRHMEPAKLTKLVRGELDWIVMKTLEKDRNRRYESASSFALDVQCYLDDEPVKACPPSVSYRLRKFARRNSRALAMTGLITMFLLVLGGGALWILRDRSNRRLMTAASVNRTLEASGNLYRAGRLPDAVVAAGEAQSLLEHGGGSEALQGRLRNWLADLEMAGRLEDARLEGSAINDESRFDFEATARAYADAFRGYGVDFEIQEPAEVVQRIRGQEIQEHLTVALDHWASLPDVEPKLRQRLTAIASGADEDAWRNQVRASAGENGPTLKNLAAASDALNQPPPTLILLGSYLHAAGEVEAAISLLRQAQRRYPGDFWINERLAYFLLRNNPPDWADAIRFLTAAVALRPNSPGAQLRLGSALARHGKTEDAFAAYRESLRLKPNFTYAHLHFANLLASANHDFAAASTSFSRAIELDPTIEWGWVGRGGCYMSLGQPDKALADISQAIDLDPNGKNIAGLWAARGEAYLALGNLETALAEFTHAIQLNATTPRAWRGRGNTYNALGQTEKAIADWSKVLELTPGDGTARLARAHAYRALRQWDQALADFSHELLGANKHWVVVLGRGQTYAQAEQWDRAIADFSQAIELNPADGGAWSERARAFAALGRWKESATDFAKLVAIEPTQPGFWYDHATAELAAGNDDSYRDVCRAMLDRFQDTRDPVVAGHVVTTCVAAGAAVVDPGRLVTLAELACSVDGEWNMGLLGAACFRAGQQDRALECFRKKSKAHPLRAWDLLLMAMAHQDLGHADDARDCLVRAVQWLTLVGPPGPDDQGKPGPKWFNWQDEVVVRALRGEAEELLLKGGVSPG